MYLCLYEVMQSREAFWIWELRWVRRSKYRVYKSLLRWMFLGFGSLDKTSRNEINDALKNKEKSF